MQAGDSTAFSPRPCPNPQRFFSWGDLAPCAGLSVVVEDRGGPQAMAVEQAQVHGRGLPHPFATPTFIRKPLAAYFASMMAQASYLMSLVFRGTVRTPGLPG
jgi:hypothetical protein